MLIPDISGMGRGALKAFLIALILTPIARDVFRAYNVVDRPGWRKVHAYPIPRVGGIAIAIAYVISLTSFSDFSRSLPDYDSPAWKLLPGVMLVFLTGLLDDFLNLRPLVKLAGQMMAASLVFSTGIRIEAIANVNLPVWLSFPLTVIWLLLTTNALNLIDGLDGLCAGMGFMATLTLFVAAWIQGNMPLAHATFPLAGALLGFLCFNFNPATVFLGDSGALMVGFLLGCYGMIWTGKTATMLSVAVPLLTLSIPLLDVSLAIVRRSLKSQPIFSADRGHIHHRLLDRGMSPRNAVLVLYLVALTAAGFALLLSYPLFGKYQILVIVVFVLFVFAGIHQLRYSEFNMARQLLFSGEFQRTLAVKLRLDQLNSTLSHSKTKDEWWNALSIAGRDTGWSRLSWVGKELREQTYTDQHPTWSFEIQLSETDRLRVEGGPHQGANPPLNLLEFAEIVNGTFFRLLSPGRNISGAG